MCRTVEDLVIQVLFKKLYYGKLPRTIVNFTCSLVEYNIIVYYNTIV